MDQLKVEELSALNQELRANNESYRAQFAGSSAVMMLVEIDGGMIIEANDAAVAFYGYSRERLLTMRFADICVLSAGEIHQAMLSVAQEKGRQFQFQHRRADGSLRDVDLAASRIQFKGRQVLHTIVFDVTERKKMVWQLIEHHRVLVNIIEATKVGTWRWNVLTGATDFNERWAGILGYTLAELAPLSVQTWLDLAHPEDMKNTEELLHKHFQGTLDYYDCEYRMRHKNGAWVWVHDRGKVVEWQDGKPLVMTGIQTDITVRKQTEDNLRHAMGEVDRMNKELQVFVSVTSHDLQEPLRMIASYTQLLADRYKDQLDEKAQKYIAYAVDGAVRMQQYVNDLLTYSRVTANAKPVALLDANVALGEALRNLVVVIEKNAATVTHDALPTVFFDASQLVQLFQNLAGNALKFRGKEAPCINVSVKDGGSDWVFSVRDNGIGIEPQYEERIFVIFQRLHTLQEYPGTGIGLAVCKRIVEHNGGKIWFESEPGKGTAFMFTVPKQAKGGAS